MPQHTHSERLVELLEYIEQVEKLKKKATFVVPEDAFCAYQEALLGLPGVEFNLVDGGDDVWLRIARLKENPPPEPADRLAPWVILSKTPDKWPELRAETAGRDL